MTTTKAPLSIRIIYWITNVALALLTLVFTASMVFNILLYTNFFGDDMQLHTQLPVKVDFLETGNLHLNNQDIKVELVEATTKIHYFNTPSFITKKVGIAIIIVIIFTGFLFWTFRLFIKNVKEGNIFNIKNILLLKRLAYGLTAFWIYTVIYMQLAYYYIAKNLTFDNIRISSEMPDYSSMLLVALVIWVLAHVFSKGLKLQQEKDLTI